MRTYLFIATILISQLAPPRVNGAIEGSVVDSVSMLPIANVPITLTIGTLQIDAVSDQSGRFLIPNLSPGAYVVTSTLDGYFGPEISSYVFVTENQTSHTTLLMVPSGSISGNVVDDIGAPVINTAVQVLRVTYRNGIPATESAGGQSTDENGRYNVIHLRPGEYYAAASPKAGGALLRTFSPSALDLSQATMIRIHAGEEMSGINITLRKEISTGFPARSSAPYPTSTQNPARCRPSRCCLMRMGCRTPALRPPLRSRCSAKPMDDSNSRIFFPVSTTCSQACQTTAAMASRMEEQP
jgi:hypothetical protein